MSEMNIYKRLAAITAELSAVAKNLEVGYGKSAYKAVGEADVLAAVKPLESKNGVYSFPEERRVIDNYIMKTIGNDGKERQSQFMRLETKYTFVNVDEPTERVSIITYGDGVDPQDKAPGKAMTYADKYALLKAYKIITGEDPDQHASETGTYERPAPRRTRREEAKPETGRRDPDNEPCSVENKEYIKQLCQTMGLSVMEVCKTHGVTFITADTPEGKVKTFRNADFLRLKNYLEELYAEMESSL